jgi:hypothetical protein
MNFYKILNEDEKHFGLYYKTGLNIDIVPFNPYGNCRPGGIYFSREHILAFLSYGPWLRKVTLPEDARIYENPGELKKWKADRVILGERERIDVNVIRRLIDEGADFEINDSCVLRWAAEYGYIEIVKMLLELGSNPKINNSHPLQLAAGYGHIEIVKLLIPVSDPTADNSFALRWAAGNDHIEVVKLLLPVSDLTDHVISHIKCSCRENLLSITVEQITDHIFSKNSHSQEILDLINNYQKG